MSSTAHPVDEVDVNAGPITSTDQLSRLAHTLPQHIQQTVLPQVAEEVAGAIADLNRQVDGTRQLLLQSAALRRSTVLAPFLKQQLVSQASQLQRRRAQLVQVLQRGVKQWRAGGGNAGAATTALQDLWTSTLQPAMEAEEKHAHIVQAPLCPPAASLTSFLSEAVGQLRLHERVMAQVAGKPAPPSPPPPHKNSNTAQHTSPTNTASSPMPAAGEAAEDAIEVALQLLLKHTTQLRGGSASARRRDVRNTARAGAAAGGPPLHTTAGIGGSSNANENDVRVCDADAYSDEVVEVEEEDEQQQLSPTGSASRASPQPPLDAGSSRPTPTTTSTPAAAVAWLRVPGIVSLRQYCAELPWVAELAEQRYTEARERKKHSSSSGSGGGGEVGYISRHIQPGSEKGGEGGAAQTRSQAAAAALSLTLSTLGPIGGCYAPTLVASTADDGRTPSTSPLPASRSLLGTGNSVESTVARAMRHAAAAPSSANASGSDGSDRMLPSSGPQEAERVALARVIVQCVSAAVDEAWKDVEEEVVLSYCSSLDASKKRKGIDSATSAKANEKAGETEQEEEEGEVITEFLDTMRVRYAVELAAQVLAARQATELLAESEDSVIFDGARLVSLLMPTAVSSASPPSSYASPSLAGVLASVLTCTVFTLPGLEELFYVVAYCTGAAMLREVAAVTRLGSGAEASHDAQQLVIDVDAESDDADGGPCATRGVDQANEEDPATQRLAALQSWAVGLEQQHLGSSSSSRRAPCTATLATLYRLWLYLFEYVFAVSTSAENAFAAGTQSRSGGGRANSTQQQLRVSLRTARRWVEKVMEASLLRGAVECGLLTDADASSAGLTAAACLQLYWESSQADRVVRLSSAQARQALLQASGAAGPGRH